MSQPCYACLDHVHALSSRGLCDGCEAIESAIDALSHHNITPETQLRRFRFNVAAALMDVEHHREVRDGSPFCACGYPLDTSDPTESFVYHRLHIKVCRKCRCTDADCSGCIERTGQPCQWVENDLCSACV